MKLLTRWWFAALLVAVVIAVWAVTVAPWAPLHERTVAEVRVELRAPSDRPQGASSGTFDLQNERASLAVSTGPAGGTRPPAAGFLGSMDWAVTRAGHVLRPRAAWSGSLALPAVGEAPVSTTLDAGSGAPLSGLRLRVTGVASSPVTIIARLSQSRDRVLGVPVPLLLGITIAVIFGIPATTARARRSKPVIFPPTHEHY